MRKGALRRIPRGFTAIPAKWRWGRFHLAPIVIFLENMRNVARSFLKDGTRYFVLTKSYAGWRTFSEGGRAAYDGEEEWRLLKERVFSHWQPNAAFTAFAKRAHVAALRPHLVNKCFAVIDLKGFFDHVTRTKVCRALEAIGLARSSAFKIAGESTIRQGDKCTLPRGFRQSSLLATLVLEKSLFGSALTGNRFESKVTVYSDDIIFSSNDFETLADEHSQAIALLRRSHFAINPTKTQTARAEVDIFNLRMSHRTLRFTDERMWKFLEQAASFVKGEDAEHKLHLYEKLFGDYIRSINPEQEKRLRTSLGLP
ncbi:MULTISPECIES: reverse transcriptase domain-containing protein [Bradyrhizobium]|uniref:reverse transcriptase domain-containing protein n=1 Tax=Bradyrhizobium TaxID=374 RepID=UPI000943E51F|nr:MULTISPECIES: reverse transcriptase domain-containing protein [Bradyrhizobium]